MIETSIQITESRYERLIAAAEALDVSLAVVFSRLLKKSRYLFRDFAMLMRTVRYQKNFHDDEFLIMNIRLFEEDYEYAIGQRLLFKFSVSFFLRFAIDLFLDLIVENGMGDDQSDSDNIIAANYCRLNYLISYKNTPNHEIWGIQWDKRKRKNKKSP